MKTFTSKSYGKWILCGEHAVLRGVPALVFPVTSNFLQVDWKESNEPLFVEFQGKNAEPYKLLFWGVMEHALKKVEKSRSDLKGHMVMDSCLPLGAGLGASAALCVSVARFFEAQGWLEESELYEFSRSLEDVFHGESSGVDIAIALTGEPLKFQRSGDRQTISQNWKPNWYLSYCGERGATSECVGKVKQLFQEKPDVAKALDEQMATAVAMAEEALSVHSSEAGLEKLVEAVNTSNNCFRQWGLIDGKLKSHMEELIAAGALAVKPTGSGGGGYVLSLWQSEPPEFLAQTLRSV